ncbi:hypothetical protein DPMN_087089 [Dreissena polymorpha]|uniref:CCHC-type domain-containing protein n=1 Tax=Dreissena polymorpha TaxID=45954 RepID=A0A9D4KTI6_DREPO|nr:hypothetical protein DPMN_087089 [Dreissena polymorpha]
MADSEEEQQEEGKFNMATGPVDLTKDEVKLLEALKIFGIQPKCDTPQDMLRIAQAFGSVKSEEPEHVVPKATEVKVGYQYPKLSIFFGDQGKGEVTWDTFKYEVEATVNSKVFKSEQVLLGVRRAVKGSAGDVLRRLGPDVTLQEVMQKLDSTYGCIESRESVMRKFYSSQQQTGESVSAYAARLEELFETAIHLKALKRSDMDVLKTVLHAGLKKDLKHLSTYQCDKLVEYDEFKRELRKIEADMKESVGETKTCKPAVNVEKKEQSDLSEMKELLKQLNHRIDQMEKKQEAPQYYIGRNYYRGQGRGAYATSNFRGGRSTSYDRGSGHGNFYRGRGADAPRGNFRPQSMAFNVECYQCHEKGHVMRDCPANAEVICFKCREKGHKQWQCPKV